jgi:sugar lactone lactonase YvrE
VLSTDGAGSFVSLDATQVYWGDGQSAVGGVWRVPQAGGATEALATGFVTPTSVVTDGNLAYFTTYGGSRVKSVPLTGGTPTEIATATGPTMLALRGGTLYVAAIADPRVGFIGQVLSVDLPASNPVQLWSGGSPYQLTTDATHVYWTDQYRRTITRTPLGGGPVDDLVTVSETPQGIAVDGASVYFTTTEGGVYSIPLSGLADGGQPTPLATGLDYPLNLARDGASLYVALWGQAYQGVVRIPTAGGAPVPLAEAVRAYSVAVGATCAFASAQAPSAHRLIRFDR